MPTYLVHAFRWQRASIRIHIITQDLEEAAPEWIMAPATSISMLNSFYSMYDFLPPSNPPPATYPLLPQTEKSTPEFTNENHVPKTLAKRNKASISSLRSLARLNKPPNLNYKTSPNGHKPSNSSSEGRPTPSTQTSVSETRKEPRFNDWSVVKLLEQYDPEDMQTVSQPHAYVADYMVEVKLGVSVYEEMLKYEADQRAEEAILNAHNVPTTPGSAVTPTFEVREQMATLSIREARRRSRRLGWFEKLRDGLQKGADIGWFVVVCGDEERMVFCMGPGSEEQSEEEKPLKTPRSAGLRGFFSRKKDIQEEE